MKKNNIIIAVVIVIFLLAALLLLKKPALEQNQTQKLPESPLTQESNNQNPNQQIKEFTIDSWSEKDADGKWKPQFSLKEIAVKKGDKVKININVKSGRHDFKIDEFNIYKDTPTGQITTVEFIADKVGEFVYYCAQPGHRELGQWGILKVTE